MILATKRPWSGWRRCLRAPTAPTSAARHLPGGGTLSLKPLASDSMGPPVYLAEHLDLQGLQEYGDDLRALLAECPAIAAQVERPEKAALIAACLQGALADVAAAEHMARQRTAP